MDWFLGLCQTEGSYQTSCFMSQKQIENFMQLQILLPVCICMFQKKQLASVKHAHCINQVH